MNAVYPSSGERIGKRPSTKFHPPQGVAMLCLALREWRHVSSRLEANERLATMSTAFAHDAHLAYRSPAARPGE